MVFKTKLKGRIMPCKDEMKIIAEIVGGSVAGAAFGAATYAATSALGPLVGGLLMAVPNSVIPLLQNKWRSAMIGAENVREEESKSERCTRNMESLVCVTYAVGGAGGLTYGLAKASPLLAGIMCGVNQNLALTYGIVMNRELEYAHHRQELEQVVEEQRALVPNAPAQAVMEDDDQPRAPINNGLNAPERAVMEDGDQRGDLLAVVPPVRVLDQQSRQERKAHR